MAEAVAAVDGEEAVELARRDPPDPILLGVIMPRLQGFEVLGLRRRLQGDAAEAFLDETTIEEAVRATA
jgi:CheY-like chemotaxis protein